MGRETVPKYETALDYRPLVDAIEEFCAGGKRGYHDVATAANVPFPKVLRLMSGGEAQLAGHHVINLSRVTGLPLSELVVECGEGSRE